MAEPRYIPSWLLWRVFFPVSISLLTVTFTGSTAFVAWAAPKIVSSETKIAYMTKTQDMILFELRAIHKELKELNKQQKKGN